MNCGIIMTWNGSISVDRTRTNMKFRPLHRRRANANAASEPDSVAPTTASPVIFAVLRIKRPNGRIVMAFG